MPIEYTLLNTFGFIDILDFIGCSIELSKMNFEIGDRYGKNWIYTSKL